MNLSVHAIQKTSLALTLLLAILAFAIAIEYPDLIGKYVRSHEAHVWRLNLEVNSAPATVHATTLASMLERSLKSQEQIENLIISTTPTRITAHFYTKPSVLPKDLATALNAKISAIQDSGTTPQFETTFYYDALSKVENVGTNLDALRDSATQTLSFALESATNNEKRNILALASPDIILDSTQSAGTSVDINALDLLLQRLHTIRGVQKAFARNVRIPTLQVETDPRQLLQLGISPQIIHKTIQTHLRIDQGISENILGQRGYIFRKKSETTQEICTLSFQVPKNSALLHVCDVSKVESTPMFLDFYTVGTSLATLEKRIREQNKATLNPTKEKSSIVIILDSETVAQDLVEEIESAIHVQAGSPQWTISSVRKANTGAYNFAFFFASMIILAILAFSRKESFGNRRLFLFLLAHATAFWSAATLALGIDAHPQLLGIPLLAAAVAFATHRCESLLKGLHGAKNARLTFAAFSVGIAATTIFARSFINFGQSQFDTIASGALAMAAGIYAFSLAPQLMNESQASTHQADVAFHARTGLISLVVPLLGVAISMLPTINFPSTIFISLGFEGGTSVDIAQNAAANIERIARENKATAVIAAPEKTSVIQLKPSPFSLLNTATVPLEEILASLHPSIPGETNIQEKSGSITRQPVIVKSNFSEIMPTNTRKENDDDLVRFQKWMDTMQQPISSDSQNSLQSRAQFGFQKSEKKNFLSMSALVVPEWSREITRISISNIGETTLAEIHSREGERNIRANLDNFLSQFQQNTKSELQTHISDTASEIAMLTHNQTIGTLMLAAILFLAGILYFASTERALLTTVTFGAIHLTVKGVFHLFTIPHGLDAISETLLFPSTETWASTLLLTLWAILLKTADYRRAMNMSLDEAFFLQTRITRQLRRWGLIPALVISICGIFYSNVALLGGATMALWIVGGFLLPDWMLIWTKLAEWKNRTLLKLHIHFKTLLIFIFAISLVHVSKARASTDTSTIDSQCDGTVTIILPILGRPKGKEPVPQRTFLSERLAQETKCSWVEYGLTSDIIKILEGLRSTAAQSRLVSDFGSFVLKNRGKIESAAIAHLRKDDKQASARVRIFGGFYEEFLGSISFSILEFPKGSDPIVTKMSSSEEQQTQTISKLARYIRGENAQLHEELLGEVSRLPVFLEPVESLDKHPVSENIAGELNLFLTSRFINPLSSNLLERKTFFRIEKNADASKFVLNVKLRRDETRFYASITARARNGEARRSAWIEGDVSQFTEFEEEVLAVSKKILSNIEGIADYFVALDTEYYVSGSHDVAQMYGIYFRQNLGNAALSIRLRNGQIAAKEDKANIGIFGFGGSFGWQFFDVRWITGDFGVSADAGIATPPDSSSRDLWISYGGYIQFQSSLRKNFALITRTGVEQPQLFGATGDRKTIFHPVYLNALVGIGVIF